MIEVVFLAVALSMDAFAVSIGLGSKNTNTARSVALKAGLYFGAFQALMPLIGYLGGKGLLGWIETYATWVGFGLLAFVGGKMIYESFANGIEEDIDVVTHRVMLVLAVATSLDALAAGFSLNLLDVNPFIACLSFGIVTFVVSWVGVFIGAASGTWLKSKAELFGGVVLILVGLKLLF